MLTGEAYYETGEMWEQILRDCIYDSLARCCETSGRAIPDNVKEYVIKDTIRKFKEEINKVSMEVTFK